MGIETYKIILSLQSPLLEYPDRLYSHCMAHVITRFYLENYKGQNVKGENVVFFSTFNF